MNSSSSTVTLIDNLRESKMEISESDQIGLVKAMLSTEFDMETVFVATLVRSGNEVDSMLVAQ